MSEKSYETTKPRGWCKPTLRAENSKNRVGENNPVARKYVFDYLRNQRIL